MNDIDWNEVLPDVRDLCNRCGQPLGETYEEAAGRNELRQFFWRDCTHCGTQLLVRTVQTWQ